MQNTSALWKALTRSTTAALRVAATIDGVEYTEMDPPVVRRALMSEEAMGIGNSVSAALTLSLISRNDTHENIAKSAEVVLRMWWEAEDGRCSEALPVGTFYVAGRSYQRRSGRMQLECYDAMLRANAPLSEAGITAWPTTAPVLVQAIAAAIGVTVDRRTCYGWSTDEALSIPEPDDGTTMRDMLSRIGAYYGGNWVITPENALRLKWVFWQGPTDIVHYTEELDRVSSDIVDMIGTVGDFRYDAVSDMERESRRYTITGLQWVNGLATHLLGDDAGAVPLLETPYIDTEARAQALCDRMRGEYWWPCRFEGAIYDPAAELGDWLKIATGGARDLYGMICSETVTLGTAPRADVCAPQSGEGAEETPYQSGIEQRSKQQAERIDALHQRLEAIEALGFYIDDAGYVCQAIQSD